MLVLHPTALSNFLDEHPGAVLLDVREAWEVALASIEQPGVEQRFVPMNQVPQLMQEWPQDQTTVCIDGGIDAWSTLVDPSVPRY
jgi:rhodanese-related sulfurtransferase